VEDLQVRHHEFDYLMRHMNVHSIACTSTFGTNTWH